MLIKKTTGSPGGFFISFYDMAKSAIIIRRDNRGGSLP
jgi:hypothetical protein